MTRRLTLLFALAGFVGGAALAQRTVTYEPPAAVYGVDLRRAEDGGVFLVVHARAESADGGDVLDRARRCEVGELTATQRTALATVRTAALACWRAHEGL
ncbi:MAG: hypothetical protein ACOZIN_08550 [Myxococcota bacterium]